MTPKDDQEGQRTTNMRRFGNMAGHQKARQQFRAEEYKIPHQRQYLPVSGNFKTDITRNIN